MIELVFQAKHRPRPTGSEFVYPYNLGWWRNFRMVCHFREREELDGTWWPVVDSCDQFTFTVRECLHEAIIITLP